MESKERRKILEEAGVGSTGLGSGVKFPRRSGGQEEKV